MAVRRDAFGHGRAVCGGLSVFFFSGWPSARLSPPRITLRDRSSAGVQKKFQTPAESLNYHVHAVLVSRIGYETVNGRMAIWNRVLLELISIVVVYLCVHVLDMTADRYQAKHLAG